MNQAAVASTVNTERPWCLFHSGQGAYALPLESVAEIVAVDELVPIPMSPPCLAGVLALRRDVIPVLLLGEAAHGPLRGPHPPSSVVVLKTRRGTWGILTDRDGTTVTERAAQAPAADGSGQCVQAHETAYEIVEPEVAWTMARTQLESWFAAPAGARPARGAHPQATGDVLH